MLWDEIDLERVPEREALEKAAASIFRVRREDVLIVEDLARLRDTPAPVTLELRRTGGDFPGRLGIYLARAPEKTDRAGAARAFSRALGSRVLISGADLNPYTRDLVDPQGKVRRVALDAALLDERGWARLEEAAKDETGDAAEHFVHLISVYQDLVVGPPMETPAQAEAVGALIDSLFRVMKSGTPTPEQKSAVERAVAAVAAAVPSDTALRSASLAALLEAAELVTSGALG